jgi:Flp pilus assembly protein TadG
VRADPGQHPRALRRDTGQATVELALSLPLVLLVLLGVAQVAVVLVHQVAVEHAARAGARAASVSAAPGAAASSAATAATRLAPLTVHTEASGDLVTVTVRYDEPTDVTLIGALLPSLTLVGRATVPLEPP